MHLTEQGEPGDKGGAFQACAQGASLHFEDGEKQAYEGSGVWVPKGMTAREIMAGAEVLERDFEIGTYTARSMVRAILRAIRPIQNGL
jgi:hypothetical protein